MTLLDQVSELASHAHRLEMSAEALTQSRAVRQSAGSTAVANHAAGAAEELAAEEIDFAIYAIEEAEYAILDANNSSNAINAIIGAAMKAASAHTTPSRGGATDVIAFYSMRGCA